MFPVGAGKSFVLKDTIQFGAINKVVFLNKSHRFKTDPHYGEIMRRFRVGLATKEDIQKKTLVLRMIMLFIHQ